MIIGIIGAIGSGKNTAADCLIRNHEFIEVSIAERLKEDVSKLFYMCPRAAFFGTQAQKAKERPELGGRSGRTVLEETAEHYRQYDPDIWLNNAFKKKDMSRDFVLPDVRYPNERMWIKARGGVILRMHISDRDIPPSTGHESDEHWREMEYDVRVNAHFGHIKSIHTQLDHFLSNR